MVSALRRWRSTVMRHERLADYCALSMATVGLALVFYRGNIYGVFAVVGSICLSWLSGVWVVPGSVDSYVRRMNKIIHTSLEESWARVDHYSSRSREIAEELEHMMPSREYGSFQKCLLKQFSATDDLVRDRSSFSDRATLMFEQRKKLLNTRHRLETLSGQAYIDGLVHIVTKRISLAQASAAEIRMPFVTARAQIARIKPPIPWRARHHSYVKTIDAYLTAVNAHEQTLLLNDDEKVQIGANDSREA
jgi:hypothetical protein